MRVRHMHGFFHIVCSTCCLDCFLSHDCVFCNGSAMFAYCNLIGVRNNLYWSILVFLCWVS